MDMPTSGLTLDPAEWQIVNDGVMGGMSMSRVVAAPGGGVRFEGVVSLEYGGGFASARCACSLRTTEERAPVGGFVLRVRGDGKHYRLTIFTRSATTSAREPYHYQGKFETTGGEQEIRLPLAAFSASLRGRQVAAPPLDPHLIVALGLQISDRQPGPFVIDLRAAGPFDA
jgi:hypothetical protein